MLLYKSAQIRGGTTNTAITLYISVKYYICYVTGMQIRLFCIVLMSLTAIPSLVYIFLMQN